LHDEAFAPKESRAELFAKVHVHVDALFNAHEGIFLDDSLHFMALSSS
jgi:hypothetical protein